MGNQCHFLSGITELCSVKSYKARQSYLSKVNLNPNSYFLKETTLTSD